MYAGEANGFVFEPDTLGRLWVWTKGGLYVGGLYHDQYLHIYDTDSIFIELQAAFLYQDNGTIYAMAGDHGVSVHAVTLPALTATQTFTVTVTALDKAAAAIWDPDGPIPNPIWPILITN
jgi:hypothetical protein